MYSQLLPFVQWCPGQKSPTKDRSDTKPEKYHLNNTSGNTNSIINADHRILDKWIAYHTVCSTYDTHISYMY